MILGLGLGNAYSLIFNSVLFNEFYVFNIINTFYFFILLGPSFTLLYYPSVESNELLF